MGLLSLPKGTAVLAFLSLISRPASAATSYVLDTTYSGTTFFNGWDFQTSPDLTHGFVQYVSQSDAQAAGLISAGTQAYMGVDYKTKLSTTGSGRQSVRITSQKSWTHGVFIADIAHMPDSTCGVWPAFWLLGPSWPSNGEIDIIEGVSRNTNNKMSLHTAANCVMTAGTQSGTANDLNCDGNTNGNSGCSMDSTNGASYGTGFNNNGGGVYATEWTSNYIRTWFFPKGSVPIDITNGVPNPSGWGTPQSSFQGGSGCNIDTHFASQSLVFDTTFCGDWAGNVWGGDSTCAALASTCTDYVAGYPSAFTNTYWKVNSVKVYQAGAVSSSSSTTLVTSTKTSSSSSSTKSPTTTSTSTSKSSSSTKTTTSSSSKPTSSPTKPATTSSTSTKAPTTTSKPATATSSKKTTTTTSTKATATPAGKWTSLGCYSDNVSGRALPNGKTVTGGSSAMTLELCQAACKAGGYSIAGTEYGQECWCGNAFVNGGVRVGTDGTSGCNTRCKGNTAEWCGGSNRLSAWKLS